MLATLLASAALLAAPFPETIPVPPGSNPEGIATGKGTTFYVGSRANGSVYSGSLRTGEGAILVPAQTGREAYGLKQRGGKLYVAGGPTGFALRLRRAHRRERRLRQLFARRRRLRQRRHGDARGGVLHRFAEPGALRLRPRSGTTSTLQLSGDYVHQPGFNANGIAATPNGKRLIIVQSNTGFLFTANPKTGAATKIEAPSMTMRRRHPAAREDAVRRPQPARAGRGAAPPRPLHARHAEGDADGRRLRHADHDRAQRQAACTSSTRASGRGADRTTTYDVVKVG